MCRYELAFSPKTVAHWPSPDLLEGRALIPSLNEAVRNRMCLSLDRFRARVPNLVSTFRIRHASFSIIIIIIKDGWVNLLLDHMDFLFYRRLAFFYSILRFSLLLCYINSRSGIFILFDYFFDRREIVEISLS